MLELWEVTEKTTQNGKTKESHKMIFSSGTSWHKIVKNAYIQLKMKMAIKTEIKNKI